MATWGLCDGHCLHWGVIPILAIGGRCDFEECHSRCGHWGSSDGHCLHWGVVPIVAIGGRCDIVGVVPTVATGGAVTIDYH